MLSTVQAICVEFAPLFIQKVETGQLNLEFAESLVGYIVWFLSNNEHFLDSTLYSR